MAMSEILMSRIFSFFLVDFNQKIKQRLEAGTGTKERGQGRKENKRSKKKKGNLMESL